MVKLYPVEGDSAIAELWYHECPWAQVELRGIRLDQEGSSRVSDVDFHVSLFPPPADAEPRWWEFDLPEVLEQFAIARAWLLDNEQHRLPLDDEVGLSAAGRAMEKSAEDAAPPVDDQ